MSKLLYEKSFESIHFETYSDTPSLNNLIHVHQVHGADIISTKHWAPELKADGVIASYDALKNQCIAIKTADCLPIIYQGEKSCALIHAGWRGLFQKIHIHEKLHTLDIKEIHIGPCISGESFEVSAEFREHFPGSSFFQQIDGKLYFDLVHHAQTELKAHFPQANITQSGICTFKNKQYNSYRRDKTSIRNWNILKIKGSL